MGLREVFTLLQTSDIEANGLAAFGTQLFDTMLDFAGNQRTVPAWQYSSGKYIGASQNDNQPQGPGKPPCLI